MSFESIVALVVLVALVCLALGIMIHWWRSRRKSREEWEQAKARSPRITGVGFITFGLLMVAFLVGVAAPRLAPGSLLGDWIDSGGLTSYLFVCVVGVFIVMEILERLGYPSMEIRK